MRLPRRNLSCRLRGDTRMQALLIVSAVAAIVSAGCDIDIESEPLIESEVIGVYEPTYQTGGKEAIVLQADSTYSHTYDLPDGRHYADSGRWVFIYELGRKSRPLIRFDGFVDWYPTSYGCYSRDQDAALNIEPKGWMPYIKKLKSGAIRIERCVNSSQHYNKVK